MDKQIELCVSYDIDIENIIPVITSTFVNAISIDFNKAKTDINNCEKINNEQKKHFIKYLDYLAQSNHSFSKIFTIHIIKTSDTDETIHYVELLNESKDLLSENKSLYLNYKPEIFDDNTVKTAKILTSWFPLYFGYYYHKKGHENKSCILTNDTKTHKKLTRLDRLSMLNGFSYVVIKYFYNNPASISTIISSPLWSLLTIIFNGLLYSIGSLAISNLYPYYSNILLNSVFLLINGYMTYSILF